MARPTLADSVCTKVYTREVKNFADFGDEGDVWWVLLGLRKFDGAGADLCVKVWGGFR